MATSISPHAFAKFRLIFSKLGLKSVPQVRETRSISSFYSLGHISPNERFIDSRIYHARCMSEKKNFFSKLFDDIKEQLEKNKELKENLKKFREETDKIEQSDALKEVRQKYEKMESETMKGSEVLRERLKDIKGKVGEMTEEIQKTDFGKKAGELGESVSKTAGRAAESISKSGERFAETDTYKKAGEMMETIQESDVIEARMRKGRMYQPPAVLRKRKEFSGVSDERIVQADDETLGIVMHKDSKFYQTWTNFKENNPYVNKMFDLKAKYDESDHVAVRLTRTFTDKISDMFGGMFTKTEMSEVLTEICKMDADFNKEIFVQQCKTDIIPNVLEAIVRGDLEILKDWCSEGTFNTLAHPIKQAQAANYKINSMVLDINNVDVAAAKMMDQGPVLIISFNAQQIMSVKDKDGKVIEGDPEKVHKVLHIWALCRDQEELDPRAAWRLMDISFQASEQWL